MISDREKVTFSREDKPTKTSIGELTNVW